ncbi:MAG: DNA phosphorothioation-associated putative methyltransferase [Halomonas sp. HL-93]|nr:MAG: DNA phosphorothioation-associated putative methyltransferase [Halomonas sp. HL-93]
MAQPVERHKTAIGRADLSRPIKLALTDGLASPDTEIFDYGCGRGQDIARLSSMGFKINGWDPFFRPDAPRNPASIVNLGYVVNVIEDPRERDDALRDAYSLAKSVLVVSARLTAEARDGAETADHSDGHLTSRGTFQKLFEQTELKNWIDQTLDVTALPAGPGVFYVFRNDEERVGFQASRYRRRAVAPRLSRSETLFNEHEALLQPLIDFWVKRGRMPAENELGSEIRAIREVFGSSKRAFQVIKRVTDAEQWDEILAERTQDLQLYLALSQFDGRPRYSELPEELKHDVKAFFSNYTKACQLADELLFSLGDPEVIDAACRSSEVGKLTPSAIYVHESAIEALPPILRLYEGCARGYIGRVDGANVIKLHRGEPKVSYLTYPEFETDPHPSLAHALTVNLQTFRVKSRRYSGQRNPPILHRKEAFVAPDHPLHAKFARLTRIEESKGLYEDSSRIGTRDGWNAALTARGLRLAGHRLVKSNASRE